MHAPKTRTLSHRRGRGHTGGAQVAHHWVLPTPSTLARVHLEECVEIFNVNTDAGARAAGAGVGVGGLARMPARAHDVRRFGAPLTVWAAGRGSFGDWPFAFH